jgi:quercetin dioxygenase-like cupin family protein
MAKLFAKEDLPHLRSTRDTRDRLDLITASVSVDATKLRADRIKYHPGDTAAAHYHSDCHHIFHVLGGTGILHVDAESLRLSAGMTVIVKPDEVHWFENDSDAEFSFVEYWAPPPTQTVWTVDDDVCTWEGVPAAVG